MRIVPRRRVLKFGAGAAAWLAFGRSVNKADAIVIGAGASGCNVAWHLRQKGLSVLVLEATSGPATQASKNAAGFVAHWSAVHVANWGKNEWEMQHYGIKFCARMASSDKNTGFVRCGIAYLYRSPDAWRKVQPRIEEARNLGTRLEILTAKRAAEVLPQIKFEQVAGIAFDPDSVRVRASDMIPALARQAETNGVYFEYNIPVLDLAPGGVRTARGDYSAKSVIVTAGAWTRPLLERAGKRCPANPLAEIRYTTKPIAEIKPNLPLLIFSDYGFYIREERGGLLVGGGDPHPAPKDREIDPSNPPLAGNLRPDQAYRVRNHIREIEDIMPALKHAEIDQIAGGIPTFTTDTHFIADAVPGQTGLYALSGCQEAGITHGPGLGLMMSELITRGETTWDRSAYRLSRFGGTTLGGRS